MSVPTLAEMRRELARVPAVTEEQARAMVAGLEARLRVAEFEQRAAAGIRATVAAPSPLYDAPPARRDLPRPVATLALL